MKLLDLSAITPETPAWKQIHIYASGLFLGLTCLAVGIALTVAFPA